MQIVFFQVIVLYALQENSKFNKIESLECAPNLPSHDYTQGLYVGDSMNKHLQCQEIRTDTASNH